MHKSVARKKENLGRPSAISEFAGGGIKAQVAVGGDGMNGDGVVS